MECGANDAPSLRELDEDVNHASKEISSLACYCIKSALFSSF
jgi:hypothetical protein